MSKAILKVGYSCNNRCIFCHAVPKRKYPDLSTAEILKKIALAKKKGVKILLFSGGEPTLRPDLGRLLGFACELGLQVGLITNGIRLAEQKYLKSLLPLQEVYVSFYSTERGKHKMITCSDTYHRTMKALDNLERYGIDYFINLVVNQYNIKDLSAVIELFKTRKMCELKFSLQEPVGKKVLAPLRSVAECVQKALQKGMALKLPVRWDGFPCCLMNGYAGLVSGLYTRDIKYISEVYDKDFYPADRGNKVYVKDCALCPDKHMCEGIYKDYAKSFKVRKGQETGELVHA